MTEESIFARNDFRLLSEDVEPREHGLSHHFQGLRLRLSLCRKRRVKHGKSSCEQVLEWEEDRVQVVQSCHRTVQGRCLIRVRPYDDGVSIRWRVPDRKLEYSR